MPYLKINILAATLQQIVAISVFSYSEPKWVT